MKKDMLLNSGFFISSPMDLKQIGQEIENIFNFLAMHTFLKEMVPYENDNSDSDEFSLYPENDEFSASEDEEDFEIEVAEEENTALLPSGDDNDDGNIQIQLFQQVSAKSFLFSTSKNYSFSSKK